MVKQLKLLFMALVLGMGTSLTSCTLEDLQQVVKDQNYLQVGLQSLLKVSTDTSVRKLAVTNGYFGDALVKILLPREAEQLEQGLRLLGQEQLVNDLVLRLNRAAEAAATKATPIFVRSITNITFDDALGIVNGRIDTAATAYLRRTTSMPLYTAFKPQIDTVLRQPLVAGLSAQDSWVQIIGLYDQARTSIAGQVLGLRPISTDLSAHVTQKALDGLFLKIRGHEQRIRGDIGLRVTPEIRRLWQ